MSAYFSSPECSILIPFKCEFKENRAKSNKARSNDKSFGRQVNAAVCTWVLSWCKNIS